MKRNDEQAVLKNDFLYDYYAGTNKLKNVKTTQTQNYNYDAIGNLTEDREEGTVVSWTPYGKVREVHKGDTVTVSYRYDASGNRVEKKIVKADTTLITTYVRDAGGNVMGIYHVEPDAKQTTQWRTHTRLTIQGNSLIPTSTISIGSAESEVYAYGSSRFELTFRITEISTPKSIAVEHKRAGTSLPNIDQRVLSFGPTGQYGIFGSSVSQRAYQADDRFIIVKEGAAISIYQNGALVHSYTPSVEPTEGVVKIFTLGRLNDVQVVNGGVDTVMEMPLYGSSRLGNYEGTIKEGRRTLGKRKFELSNHLGNVLSVVTDNVNMTGANVWATVASATDYTAFGTEMKGRTFSDSTYRYGFNGQEKSKEIARDHYVAEFWEYDSRLGRRWNLDPIVIPGISPYACFENNPIFFNDPNGDCSTCPKP